MTLYSTQNLGKSSDIERFNGTPKNLILKQFTVNNDTTCINILQDVVHNYNNTYHAIIKITPSAAQKKEKCRCIIS